MRRMFSEKQIEEMSKGIAKEVVQNDKDILSQIVYDEEDDILTLPIGILPIFMSVDNEEFYFDVTNGIVIDNVGAEVCEFIINENHVSISDYSLISLNAVMPSHIEYICFNDNGENYYSNLNTYYLYNPITATGTKLYSHSILYGGDRLQFVSTSQNYSGIVISTQGGRINNKNVVECISIYSQGGYLGDFLFNDNGLTFTTSVDINDLLTLGTDTVTPL